MKPEEKKLPDEARRVIRVLRIVMVVMILAPLFITWLSVLLDFL